MGLPQNSGDDPKLTLVENFCNNLGTGFDLVSGLSFGRRS